MFNHFCGTWSSCGRNPDSTWLKSKKSKGQKTCHPNSGSPIGTPGLPAMTLSTSHSTMNKAPQGSRCKLVHPQNWWPGCFFVIHMQFLSNRTDGPTLARRGTGPITFFSNRRGGCKKESALLRSARWSHQPYPLGLQPPPEKVVGVGLGGLTTF